MSINLSEKTDVVLNKAVCQILGGYQAGALTRMIKCGLFSEEQIARIQKTLTEMNPTYLFTGPLELKNRIGLALNLETSQHPTFTSEFANADPCTFEFRGAGTSYNKRLLKVQDKCHRLLPELCEDIISQIYLNCLSEDKIIGLRSLACVNKHFHKHIIKIADEELIKISSGLTILDAQTLKIEVNDEPPIKKLALIKCFQDMAPHVEKNAGLTLLTMPKNLTLNQLVNIAELVGIKADAWSQILIDLGDVPIEHTYRIVITNSIFINTRNECYDKQHKLVLERGCLMPTVQEYAALCIFTMKIFNRCLYGRDQLTYGRSSSRVQGHPVVIGGFSLNRFSFLTYHFASKLSGAGGRRKA